MNPSCWIVGDAQFSDFMDAVAAIEIIKTHWNLSYWTGDPCLNVPYDWTECSVDGIPRVTKL